MQSFRDESWLHILKKNAIFLLLRLVIDQYGFFLLVCLVCLLDGFVLYMTIYRCFLGLFMGVLLKNFLCHFFLSILAYFEFECLCRHLCIFIMIVVQTGRGCVTFSRNVFWLTVLFRDCNILFYVKLNLK